MPHLRKASRYVSVAGRVLAVMLGWLGMGAGLRAAESLADLLAEPGIQLGRPADRARVVDEMRAMDERRRGEVRAKALARGLPMRVTFERGRIQELVGFQGEKPLYFTTHNANAAISTAANLMYGTPYSLSGLGVVIGLWDGGSARSTHQEFGGRVRVMDGAAAAAHATHVGGTLIASGVQADARGMAWSATIDSYDWNSDTTEMTARAATAPAQADKIYLSNHSYGYISGWNYVNGGNPFRVWEWYGAGTAATSIESDFGLYNTYARDSDALAYSAPYYLIFRSAGNERTDNPSAGQAVALSPGSGTVSAYNSALHPGGDGSYRGGFDSMGFNALAKNVLTVGSVADAVTGGIRDPSRALVSSFSSWGPTDDGRIKPDVVANGDGLKSSLSASDSSYGIYSGTSMSSPNATGSAALLVELYSRLFSGQAMRSSSLKGLLIHTADDLGNAGPDYKYGWGLINTQGAADLIRDQQALPEKRRLTEDQLTTSVSSQTTSFIWDGSSPIVATLCWTDPAGTALSTSDSRSPRLVNNLDVKVIAPNGTTYLPYVMPFVGTWTQASMDQAATTGVNVTDNVEQVRIAAPPVAGAYQVVVSFSGALTNGNQYYSLLLSGSSAEPPPPPPLALTGVTPASALPGVVTIELTGTGFRADSAVKLARSGQADLLGTGVVLVGDKLRAQVDLTTAAAGVWDVVVSNPDNERATLSGAFTVIGAIWSETFEGEVSDWTSVDAGNSWRLSTAQSQSPTHAYFAPGGNSLATTTTLVSPAISIASGASDLQFKFWQSFSLQAGRDNGRMELNIDNSPTWTDVADSGSGAVFASNGYNNSAKGKGVWSGGSGGFIETVVNLTDTNRFAGHQVRFRWTLTTVKNTNSAGWYVDTMSLLGGGDITNQAPVITTAAKTDSTETVMVDTLVYQVVRGVSSGLSVAATDDGGETALSYTWSVTSGPGAVFFPVNGNHAASLSAANFEAAGDYTLSVAVRDSQGLTSNSQVNVRVMQSASGMVVSPPSAIVMMGASQQFTASVIDQFGAAMASQPPSFAWATSGGGSIASGGLFTASAVGGPYVVTGSASGFSSNSNVTVTPAPATVLLGNLNHVYDSTAKQVSVTTTPAGLAVAVTYNGGSALPVAVGSYAVEANVTDPNYQGTASGSLVIAPPATWASWSSSHFSADEIAAGQAAEDADPDHDGWLNLAEYAIGSNPHEFTASLIPVVDADGLSVTFTRPGGLIDVLYGVESSIGLDAWQAIPMEVIVPGVIETVRARDPLDVGDASRRFLRLRFERR